MTIESTAVAPGWFADPAGSHSLRWWDGTQWTNHMRMPEVVAPVVAPTPTPTAQPTAVQPTAVQLAPGQVIQETPPDLSLSAYTPGGGFGGSNGGQQLNFGVDRYAIPSLEERMREPNNAIAWGALLLGIFSVAVMVVVIVFAYQLPGAAFIYPVFGIPAIITSIRALAQRPSRRVTVIWPSLGGLFLGLVTEALVVLLTLAPGTVLKLGDTAIPTPVGPISTGVNLGPTGVITQYYSGHISAKHLPTANSGLVASLIAEQRIVAAVQSAYGSGPYPSEVAYHPTTGDVNSTDGHDFGDLLPPSTHLAWQLSPNGGYVLVLSSGTNISQVAVYQSSTQKYFVMCEQDDTSCNTHSSVKPVTRTVSGN